MEACARLSKLRKVAHAYVLHGLTTPLVRCLIGFDPATVAHQLTEFSAGGALLSAMGASTGLGTLVANLNISLWIWLAELAIGL